MPNCGTSGNPPTPVFSSALAASLVLMCEDLTGLEPPALSGAFQMGVPRQPEPPELFHVSRVTLWVKESSHHNFQPFSGQRCHIEFAKWIL